MERQKEIIRHTPNHKFFIGIDSDGCVFDSMEVKQKEFFIPTALKIFNLFRISKPVRETWEFVNLYSCFRGGNRFISLVKTIELLGERNEVRKTGVSLPDLTDLKAWIVCETRLGNATLRKYLEENPSIALEKVLHWSETVNREISEWLHNIPPFPSALKAIEIIHKAADILVVSQTPLEALEKEWFENDIRKYVSMIAGQEHGTKSEHIAMAAKGKYDDDKILMIGDALGDLSAAKANGVLFYPIIPGKEEGSWKKFNEEILDTFLKQRYKGITEDSLISEFRKSLPERAPWKL